MKKGVLAAAALAAALVAPAAQAQANDPSGIYLGGSIGRSQYKDTCKNLVVTCDDQDTTWRFFGGYQWNRNWSAELGYGNYGEASGSGTTTLGVPGSFARETYGFDLTGIGSFGLTTRLSGFGRLGVYMMRTTYEENIPGFFQSHSGQTNSGLTYGAGLGYTVGRLGLRAEWLRHDNVGGGTTGPSVAGDNKDEIDVFLLSLLFRFF